jgi:geranylgeranyl pyrophosphate synthase
VLFASEVGEKLQELLSGAGLTAPLIDFVIQPLTSPGKILSTNPSTGWAELVAATCMAAQGDRTAAVRVAASVECLAAALDVLDEIEDGDQSLLVESAGLPRALNASTALMFAAQNILSGLTMDGITPARVPEFSRAMSRLGLAATSGQHEDLSKTADSGLTVDEALQITRQKSGSLAACACVLGAMLGTTDQKILQLYETFGYDYGTMLQLSNDLHDAQDLREKSDLRKLKPTVPIVFYARQSPKRVIGELNPEGVISSGALHFTWAVIELQRKRCLQELEALRAQNQAIEFIRDGLKGLASQKQDLDDNR